MDQIFIYFLGLADGITQVVVEVHGLVNEVGNLFGLLPGVDVEEKRAVVDKSTHKVLYVFLDVSKIHVVCELIRCKDSSFNRTGKIAVSYRNPLSCRA